MYGVSASEVPEISVDELRRVDAWSWIMIFWVVVSSICRVHPYLGKIPILTNIFQMGWNHQPDYVWFLFWSSKSPENS